MNEMFKGCTKLQNIEISETFRSNNLRYIISMFEGCSSLMSLDLSHFNTENVENMEKLFLNCENIKNLDFSNIIN